MLVTHNEMFLHALATRLVVFKRDGIEVFEGTYSEFLQKQGWEDEQEKPGKKVKSAPVNKKLIRQKKSDLINQKSKLIRPVKKEIGSLEDTIEKNDQMIALTNDKLLVASNEGDGQQIQKLSKQLADLEKQNDELFDRLEKKTDEMEKIESDFDQRLKEIERGD